MKKDFKSKRKVWRDETCSKYILGGERNVRYYDRILSNQKEIL